MIILDTNVVSVLMRSSPDPRVVNWLDRQPRTSIWTTSITLLEIRFGLQSMPSGKRQRQLTEAFEVMIASKIGGRIAAFDAAAANQSAKVLAARKKKGRPVELRDTMIAGIALATRGTLATQNTMHFDDLEVRLVNPWID